MTNKKPPIINLDPLDYQENSHGQRFAARNGAISRMIGVQKLGYRITIVPPGKTAWPSTRWKNPTSSVTATPKRSPCSPTAHQAVKRMSA